MNIDEQIAALNNKPEPNVQGVDHAATTSNIDDKISILNETPNKSSGIVEGKSYNLNSDEYKDYMDEVRPEWGIDMLNKQRALNQSNWEKTWNATKQAVLGEIVGGTITGVGAIAELPVAIYDEAKGKDADFQNFLTDLGETITAATKKSSPIYRVNPGKSWDIGDFGWWAENAPSVASSLSMLIPAAGVTKGISYLGKAMEGLAAFREASLASTAAKEMKLAKGLTQLSGLDKSANAIGDAMVFGEHIAANPKAAQFMVNFGDKAKYWGKAVTTGLAMRQAENFRESLQLYNDVQKNAITSFQNDTEYQLALNSEIGKEFQAEGRVTGNKDIDKQELANFFASKAGWKAYQVNAVNALFDIWQVAPLFKGMPTVTRTGDKWWNMSKEVAKSLGVTFTGKEKAARFGYNALSWLAHTGSEGVEEAINAVGTEEGKYLVNRNLGTQKEMSGMERLGKYAADPSVSEQAFWGFLGGAVFNGVIGGLNKAGGIQVGDKKFADTKLGEYLSLTAENSDQYYKEKAASVLTGKALMTNFVKEIGKIKEDLNSKKIDGKQAIERYNDLKSEFVGVLGVTQSRMGNMGLFMDMIAKGDIKNAVRDTFTPEQLREIGHDDADKAEAHLLRELQSVEDSYQRNYNDLFYVGNEKLSENTKQQIINTAVISDYISKKEKDRLAKISATLGDLEANDTYIKNLSTEDKVGYKNALELFAVTTTLSQLEEELGGKDNHGFKPLLQDKIDKLKARQAELQKDVAPKDAAHLSKVNPKILQNKVNEVARQTNADLWTAKKDQLNTKEGVVAEGERIVEEQKEKKKQTVEDYHKKIDETIVNNPDLDIDTKITKLEGELKSTNNHEIRATLHEKIKTLKKTKKDIAEKEAAEKIKTKEQEEGVGAPEEASTTLTVEGGNNISEYNFTHPELAEQKDRAIQIKEGGKLTEKIRDKFILKAKSIKDGSFAPATKTDIEEADKFIEFIHKLYNGDFDKTTQDEQNLSTTQGTETGVAQGETSNVEGADVTNPDGSAEVGIGNQGENERTIEEVVTDALNNNEVVFPTKIAKENKLKSSVEIRELLDQLVVDGKVEKVRQGRYYGYKWASNKEETKNEAETLTNTATADVKEEKEVKEDATTQIQEQSVFPVNGTAPNGIVVNGFINPITDANRPENGLKYRNGDYHANEQQAEVVKTMSALRVGDKMLLEIDTTHPMAKTTNVEKIPIKVTVNGVTVLYLNDTENLRKQVEFIEEIKRKGEALSDKELKDWLQQVKDEEKTDKLSPRRAIFLAAYIEGTQQFQRATEDVLNNYTNTRALRDVFASNKDGKVEVEVTAITSGQVISNEMRAQLGHKETERGVAEVLSSNAVIWMVKGNGGSNTVLSKINESGDDFTRQSKTTYTNADAAYNPGVLYVLIPTNGGNVTPVPLQKHKVDSDTAIKLHSKLLSALDLITSEAVKINDSRLVKLKEFFKDYVLTRETDDKNFGGIKFFTNKILIEKTITDENGNKKSITYQIQEDTLHKNKVVLVYDNSNLNEKGKPTLVSKYELDEAKDMLLEVFQNMYRNVNIKRLASNEAFGGYNTYIEWLDATKAWSTDLGRVLDSKGNTIAWGTNASSSGTKNFAKLVISVGNPTTTRNTQVDRISDEEYNAFVDKGTVSENRLNEIAEKIKQNLPLTNREMAIFTAKTAEVNELLRKEAPAETVDKTVSDVLTTNSEIEVDLQNAWDNISDAAKFAGFKTIAELEKAIKDSKTNAVDFIADLLEKYCNQ